MPEDLRKEKVFWIYIHGFFLSLYYAVISYSASTFLSTLIHQNNIWILYTIGSFFAIFLNFSVSRMLRKIEINKLFIIASILAALNIYLLASAISPLSICLQFVFYYAISALLYTFSSIILEEYSRNQNTGTIRGRYNAIMSCGYLLAPFFSSIFILNFGMKSIFYLSGFFGIIALFIFYFYISRVTKLRIRENNFSMDFKKLFSNYDLKYITLAQIGLSTYYTLVVIYFPFKLISVGIGFEQYLSVILPIALSPFLFMPPLLGNLEDKMSDEKEVLILAYLGLIFSLVVIALCHSTSIFTWTLILFFSRLCASSVEISTNSYFYKKVKADDVTIISTFTSTDYLSAIFFTAIFSSLLAATDIQTLFLSVSFFLCFVLVYVSKLHDTKNYQKHKVWKEIWGKSKARSKRGTVS